MAFQGFLLRVLLLVLGSLTYNSLVVKPSLHTASLNRSSFPAGFIFGAGSASYQVEGATNEGGRGKSMWDIFVHRYPDRITYGSNGDIAVDQYHRDKEDVEIMKEIGAYAYKFSISWTRVLPNGRLSGGVNREGIKYYNNLINKLLDKGIKPFVTIFHWDIPQTFEDEYGGFLSPRIIDDFRDYADLCFKEFGDRVKHWITLNKPYTFSSYGYANGQLAPARCSSWQNLNCTGGDSGTEPYLVSHHLLLSHAAAVKVVQKGVIGTTLASNWMVPFSDSDHDREATERVIDFMLGWFLDPLVNGDYPQSMRTLVGNRLPKFTKQQSQLLKGSFDFIGLNYYTTNYVAYAPNVNSTPPSYLTDYRADLLSKRNGILIGPQAASSWIHVYPRRLQDVLLYVKKKYHNPPIYITENGVDEFNNATLSLEEALADKHRIEYHYVHLWYLQRAVRRGANVKGYFAWSLLDIFDWTSGYTARFGIYYVDYKNGLKRYPKYSAHWFKSFLNKEI